MTADDEKRDYAKRLHIIEGQVRGVAKMIEEQKTCLDIVTQISAINHALRSVALDLFVEQLSHCTPAEASAIVKRLS